MSDAFPLAITSSAVEGKERVGGIALERCVDAWPCSQAGGLAVQFGLPHIVQACEAAVVIPVASLRAVGAQPALVEAIQAALRK